MEMIKLRVKGGRMLAWEALLLRHLYSDITKESKAFIYIDEIVVEYDSSNTIIDYNFGPHSTPFSHRHNCKRNRAVTCQQMPFDWR